jgi:hypothetical protein
MIPALVPPSIAERTIERCDSRARRAGELIEIAGGFHRFLAPEIADDALLYPAILADGSGHQWGKNTASKTPNHGASRRRA